MYGFHIFDLTAKVSLVLIISGNMIPATKLKQLIR